MDGSSPTTTLDLAPPADLDAEGLVLSHVLTHGILLDVLAPKHFYADANNRVYAACIACHERGDPIDIVTVRRELDAQGRLKSVGVVGLEGASYLATLLNCQPATAYADKLVKQLIELYRRRVLADAALRVRVELMLGELTSATAWDRFKDIVKGAALE